MSKHAFRLLGQREEEEEEEKLRKKRKGGRRRKKTKKKKKNKEEEEKQRRNKEEEEQRTIKEKRRRMRGDAKDRKIQNERNIANINGKVKSNGMNNRKERERSRKKCMAQREAASDSCSRLSRECLVTILQQTQQEEVALSWYRT